MPKDYDWTGWSDWEPLSSGLESKFANVTNGPGAYVIAFDQALARCAGTDEHGFLTVGESSRLQGRLKDFCGSAIQGHEGHMAGWRYNFFKLARRFPIERLRFRWKAAKTKEEASEVEARMMLVYLLKHRELPPLNYKYNWTEFKKHGWTVIDGPDGPVPDTTGRR